ncbi:MAG: ABC transporter permease [Gammaproteobacteria bacterium]|nr:ABC transporter permease [Gammaproteobacteria bacterium]
MFKMFFLVAVRKLMKERVYVIVNILSLALGIGSFLILALYLRSELTYDQHFTNHDEIYRVSTHFTKANGTSADYAVSQEGLGPLLAQSFPQLSTYVRFRNSSQNVLRYDDKRFSWDDIYLVDENVFDVFDHEIVAGDVETALDDINSIAISESFARSYFGDEDPIGKTLKSDSTDYRVTLVFADLPESTHLKYNALYPYRALSKFVPDYEDNYIRGLTGVGVFTYLKLNPAFDLASFDHIVTEFVDLYMQDGLARMGETFKAEITPLDEVHFGPSYPGDRPNGNIFYVYAFAAVALFILLIACINYMNLATARATKRSKEVGMRKVVGASRSQLIGQFLGESLVFTIIALLLGILLAVLALNFTPIATLMGKEALLSSLANPTVFAGLVLLTFVVTILSGLYPAFYLSAISPKAALTKVQNSNRRGMSVRQLLVFAQLTISIGVITCTLLMSQQMRFVAGKPLGFNKENQVWIDLRGVDVIEDISVLRNELIAETNIINVTDTAMVPGFGNSINNVVPIENNEGVISPEQVDRIVVGANYFETLGIEIMQGRGFSSERDVESNSVVMVNEAMVRKMGWDDPIGKQIGDSPNFQATIIGVTSDFHYAPLNNEIGPLLIQLVSNDFSSVPPQTRALQRRSLIVNITGENVPETLEIIEEKIRQFDPAHIFAPSFLDERLNELYRSEINLMELTEIFAGICIFISAMGLFGLAAFNTQQRNREIGVRKILGASSGQIIVLLCRSVVVMIAIAAIPATLFSYLAMDSWLERFAYRFEPNFLQALFPYAIAVLAVACVALTTVVVQSLKTAQANPIDALRYE